MRQAAETPMVFACAGEDLVGVLHAASGAMRDIGVVIVVGGPQYRVGSHRQFVLMARDFAAAGYTVLRFDYRGMGDSSGVERTFDSVDADIRSAVDALAAAVPSLRGVALWGLCDAASAVLMYCSRDARVAGVMLANPWVRTQAGEARTYLRYYYFQRLLQRSFWRKVLAGGFKIGKAAQQFTATVRNASGGAHAAAAASPSFVASMLAGLRAFDRPVQVLLSERDLTAQEFADLCRTDGGWRRAMSRESVAVAALPRADHTFSTRQALEQATRMSLTWLAGLSRSAP